MKGRGFSRAAEPGKSRTDFGQRALQRCDKSPLPQTLSFRATRSRAKRGESERGICFFGILIAHFVNLREDWSVRECTKVVYTGATMPNTKRARATYIRRSITLPPRIAKQVETIARQRALSDNRVLVELIEQGIEAAKQKEKAFFQLAERFRAASDPEQVKQLGNELGRFVFGE